MIPHPHLGSWYERLTKLHILGEVQTLVHRNVAISLEQHHSHGTTGKHVTNDEFRHDIQPDLNIRRGLDDSNRYHPHESHDQTDEECPPGEMGGKSLGDAEGDTNHDKRDDEEPPDGNRLETVHKTTVDIFFLAAKFLEPSPEVFAVEQAGVDEDTDHGGEGETVADGEGGGKEERRVFLVLLLVKGVMGREDFGDVVDATGIVVAGGVADGQVLVVEGPAVVQGDSEDPVPAEHADQGVGNSVPWGDERAEVEAGNLGPVEGHGDEGETGPSTEELVDNDVLGLDISDPGEDTQERGNIAREPVPAEGADHHVEEEAVLSDLPAGNLAGVRLAVVMQGREECSVDEGGRPDHGAGGDQEAVVEAGKTEAQHLGRDGHEDLESPAKAVVVKRALGEQHISGIGGTTAKGGISHDDNDGMFLLAERARVDTDPPSKEPKGFVRDDPSPEDANRVGAHLGDVGRDDNIGLTHGEQHVQGRSNGRENQADGPGAKSIAVAALIEVGHGSAHFGVGRVVDQLMGGIDTRAFIVGVQGDINLLVDLIRQVGIPMMLLFEVLQMASSRIHSPLGLNILNGMLGVDGVRLGDGHLGLLRFVLFHDVRAQCSHHTNGMKEGIRRETIQTARADTI